MTYFPPEQRSADGLRRQWSWFAIILTVLSLLGAFAAFLSIWSLAMATDPCYGEDSPFRVCQLTARGQGFLVAIPWLALLSATVCAVVSALILAKRHKSPLWGLWFWVAGGVVTMFVANEIAYLV